MEKLELSIGICWISWKMVCCPFCCCCVLSLSAVLGESVEEIAGLAGLEVLEEKLAGIGIEVEAVVGGDVVLEDDANIGVALDAEVGAERIEEIPAVDLADLLAHRVVGEGVPMAKRSAARTSAQVSATRASSAPGRASVDLLLLNSAATSTVLWLSRAMR